MHFIQHVGSKTRYGCTYVKTCKIFSFKLVKQIFWQDLFLIDIGPKTRIDRPKRFINKEKIPKCSFSRNKY